MANPQARSAARDHSGKQIDPLDETNEDDESGDGMKARATGIFTNQTFEISIHVQRIRV